MKTRKTIIIEDITKIDSQAIVNAANSDLVPGGGVCGAIYASAGKFQLDDYIRNSEMWNQQLPIARPYVTPGFNLCNHIIHVVAPKFNIDGDVEECMQLISAATWNVCELAKTKTWTSIAFPLLGSGIYGNPIQEVYDVMNLTIDKWINANPTLKYLVDIYIVVHPNDESKLKIK